MGGYCIVGIKDIGVQVGEDMVVVGQLRGDIGNVKGSAALAAPELDVVRGGTWGTLAETAQVRRAAMRASSMVALPAGVSSVVDGRVDH